MKFIDKCNNYFGTEIEVLMSTAVAAAAAAEEEEEQHHIHTIKN